MKAFIYWWSREDVLFASAVLPAALAWIFYESIFAGAVTFALAYAVIVGVYEYLALKLDWPHATIAALAKDVLRFYSPR